MAKKKDRSRAYWLHRLERDYPVIHGRLKSGALKSVRQARIEAGLLRQPDPLDTLKRLWNRLSAADRARFQYWTTSSATSKHPPSSLVGSDGLLTSAVTALVDARMRRSDMKVGQLAKAMGRDKLDPRTGFALRRRWAPTQDFLKQLSVWLETS